MKKYDLSMKKRKNKVNSNKGNKTKISGDYSAAKRTGMSVNGRIYWRNDIR